MITESRASLSPLELRRRLQLDERLQLVDVRTPQEFDSEHIPGAINIPLEQVASRVQDLHPSDPVVLVCHSGRRAGICQQQISMLRSDLIVLEGGTKEWISAGLPTLRTKSHRLPIMRQVQIVAGTLVLLGALFGRYVHPNWGFLAAFVGAGLVFAGASGFCGMANLLLLLPWNRSRPAATCEAA